MTTTNERNFFDKISREEVYSKLIDIFGAPNVSKKQVDLYPYSYDMTENEAHMPDFVVIAENKEQLIELVNFCNKYVIPITPYISGNNVGF